MGLLHKQLLAVAASSLICLSLSADDEIAAIPNEVLTRADNIPLETLAGASDAYLEGYIQALIDVHYYEYQVAVIVKDHKVMLANLPHNDLLSSSIISFVKDLPGVTSVEVVTMTQQELEEHKQYVEQPKVGGVWFPQSTVLFAPLIADPRQPINSAAIRWGDRVIGDVVAAVSLGDDFPVFRWLDVFRWHGDMQIGIEAGIWSVFNYSNIPNKKKHESCELVNTDFLVGLPLTYAAGPWSFRLRVYHISSHLGDEYLCNRKHACKHRKNPSMEAVDFFSSYQASSHLRLYFGPGVVFHSDRSFKIKPLYLEYGLELRVLGTRFIYNRIYGTAFLAIDVQNWQQRGWNFDFTGLMGYEISKLQGIGRKMRIYLGYHHGYSYEGQFFNRRTDYGEFGISWGF